MISIPKKFSLGIIRTAKSFKDLLNALIGYQKPITLKDGTIVVWDLHLGYNAKLTLAGSRTLSLQGLTDGDYGTIEIIQGGSGTYTLTLPSGSKVANGGAGALTLSTTVGAIDIATFYYNGTRLYWTLSTDFS